MCVIFVRFVLADVRVDRFFIHELNIKIFYRFTCFNEITFPHVAQITLEQFSQIRDRLQHSEIKSTWSVYHTIENKYQD